MTTTEPRRPRARAELSRTCALLAAGVLAGLLGQPGRAGAAGPPAMEPVPAAAPLAALDVLGAAPAAPARTELALLDLAAGVEPLSAHLQSSPAPAVTAAAAGPASFGVTASGLSWFSGATDGGFQCLAQMRHRALDVEHVYVAPQTFTDMVQNTGSWVPRYASKAPVFMVSLALLPKANKSQFSQCAAGAFDGYFRQVGANLRQAHARAVIIRLGWEANIGSDSHPWGVDSPAQVPTYKACWRRAATQIKAGSGNTVLMDWTSAKKTDNTSLHVADMYPGSDIVDIIGVHYYDSGPEKNTQALWNQYYSATFGPNPWGIKPWLDFARAHGKRLGVGEWGVWDQGQPAAQADDPVYIDNMYKFFKANAGSIAYETYFNAMADQHLLCPSTRFPKAAAMYAKDWSGR